VTNAGLVDGFAVAISSITAGMITQVVSNWGHAVAAGVPIDPWATATACGAYVAHTALVVLVLNCQRRIPLVYFARKSGGGMSAEDEEKLTTYVPIKAVASGVMPILFADMIVGSLSSNSGFLSTVFYISIVVCTCLVDFNNVPNELAEMLTKMGTRVPGVRPGTATVAYLQEQQSTTRLFGAFCFVILLFASLWFNSFLGSYSAFFSFTSNIILVRSGGALPVRAASDAPRRRWPPFCRAKTTSRRCGKRRHARPRSERV
jgi:preprotein translocase subunit SecY